MSQTASPRAARYVCPACRRWCGQHITTSRLARHTPPGQHRPSLCAGPLRPLKGLPAVASDPDHPAPHAGPYIQLMLFGP